MNVGVVDGRNGGVDDVPDVGVVDDVPNVGVVHDVPNGDAGIVDDVPNVGVVDSPNTGVETGAPNDPPFEP